MKRSRSENNESSGEGNKNEADAGVQEENDKLNDEKAGPSRKRKRTSPMCQICGERKC